MRPTFTVLTCMLLTGLLPGTTWAELNLPKKTIVVQDFSRRRRDLLDTLKVNLPGAKVEIDQFRGAEVLLRVVWISENGVPPEEMDESLLELRRHCDGLIRRAYPGMFLSSDSNFAIRPSSSLPLKKSRLNQLRSLRFQMPPLPKGGLTPEDRSLEAERAGMGAAFTTDPEALTQKALARKLAESRGSQMESGPNSGSLETVLSESEEVPRREQPILLQRLHGSGEISPETLQEVQDFHRRRGLAGSSQNTVRGIYASIFAARQLEGETTEESPPTSPALPSLRQELEALFVSPQEGRNQPGSRLGLSMVSFPAPDPSH